MKRVSFMFLMAVFLTLMTHLVFSLFNIPVNGWLSSIFTGIWVTLSDYLANILFKKDEKS